VSKRKSILTINKLRAFRNTCTKGKPADPRYLDVISMGSVYSFFIVAESLK
jgi:hypothetical protein